MEQIYERKPSKQVYTYILVGKDTVKRNIGCKIVFLKTKNETGKKTCKLFKQASLIH